MKVKTLPLAEQAIRKTALHIKQEFGRQSRDKFLAKVNETRTLLEDNPYLGSVEPLLSGRASAYRSVVVAKVNKIVYRIMDDRIEIADFWDVRREPQALAGEVDENATQGQ